MQRDAWYPGLVSAIRTVICWCSAFWLFTMSERGEPLGIQVLPYLVFGLVCYFFFIWFLRKPRAIPVLAAVGAVFWIVGSVILLKWFSTLIGFTAHVFGVVSVLTVVVFNVRSCMEPPVAAKSISALEVTTMFFVFFLWAQIVYGWEFTYSLPLLCASALSASVVIYQRLSSVGGTAGHGRLRGVAIVAVMLAVIAGVLLLFMRFGAGPLGEGALMLYYGVIYFLKLAWRTLERVLYWLMMLLPETDGELLAEPPPEMIMVEEMPEEMQLPPWLLTLLGIVGICIVAALIGYILFRLRKLRLGGKTVGSKGAAVERKKLPFGRWLRNVLTALRNRLWILYASVTMRGSPQELYLYLERVGRRLDCRQQPGETPCAFVRRAAQVTAESAEPDLPQALETLARTLGACLYADEEPEPLSRETVRCIRRSFRKALRKGQREQLRRWFGEKLSEKKQKTMEAAK